jgi:hypothetical protein
MHIQEQLIAMYLDYVNNYITRSRYAEEHGLSIEDVTVLLDMGRRFHEESVASPGW